MLRFISLVHVQAQMQLRANAARTYLSYAWWLFEPLLYVGLFYLVFEVLLLRGTPGFFYFLIVGKISFLWVSKSLGQGAGSIEGGRSLIGQTYMPMLMFPYVSLFETGYKQTVVFLMLFAVMFLGYGSTVNESWWWLAPVILVNLLFIISLVLPFAWLVAVVPDVKMVLPIITIFLLFTSGIFFDVRELEPEAMELLLTYNPLAFILDAYRQILMRAQVPDLEYLLRLGGVCMAVIGVWHIIYARSQYFLATKVLHS